MIVNAAISSSRFQKLNKVKFKINVYKATLYIGLGYYGLEKVFPHHFCGPTSVISHLSSSAGCQCEVMT